MKQPARRNAGLLVAAAGVRFALFPIPIITLFTIGAPRIRLPRPLFNLVASLPVNNINPHSRTFSIASRVRRKRQRLPSSLVIESAVKISAQLRLVASALPMNAYDFQGLIRRDSSGTRLRDGLAKIHTFWESHPAMLKHDLIMLPAELEPHRSSQRGMDWSFGCLQYAIEYARWMALPA